MELVSSPFTNQFDNFIALLESDGLVCSPYIGAEPVDTLLHLIERRSLTNTVALSVVTDLSLRNVVQGSTDLSAVIRIAEQLPKARVHYVPRLHAKVYIAQEDLAIIGSANFTRGGSKTNLEYGVSCRDAETIKGIRHDIESYARLGGLVSLDRLRSLRDRTAELRCLVAAEQGSISRHLREASSRVEQAAEDDLIRIRVEGRSVNAIFCDTILYLLRRGPLSTVQLGNLVQQMHPDMCDDTTDRIIDGHHYGKLWKHQVRNAQQHLKSQGKISNDKSTGLWLEAP